MAYEEAEAVSEFERLPFEGDEDEPRGPDLTFYPDRPILPPGQVGTIVVVVDGEVESETRIMVTENVAAYPDGPRNVSFLVDPEDQP